MQSVFEIPTGEKQAGKEKTSREEKKQASLVWCYCYKVINLDAHDYAQTLIDCLPFCVASNSFMTVVILSLHKINSLDKF